MAGISIVTADGGNNPAALTQDWFNSVKAAGHQGFATSVNKWASTEYWPEAGTFLDRALTAGLFVGVYCRFPEGWENGLKGLEPDVAAKLRMYVLDVEPEPDGKHPVESAHVDGLVKSGQRPMIYSNAGMWAEVMGDVGVKFATVPLWDRALRSKAPTGLGQPPLWPFAGWNDPKWQRRRVWQWMDPARLYGVDTTLNLVDARWL